MANRTVPRSGVEENGPVASGQALVELALIAPMILLLAVGALGVGVLANTSLTLRGAAREAAVAASAAVVANVSPTAVAATAQVVAHQDGAPSDATVAVTTIR